ARPGGRVGTRFEVRPLRLRSRQVLALAEEVEERHGGVELARGELVRELVEPAALRLDDGRAVATRRLVALLGCGAHFLRRRYAPLLALHRLDRVCLEPGLHARAQALAAEREPPLPIERVRHEHVLEAAERALAVDGLHELVAELAVLDGRDEALHPAIL